MKNRELIALSEKIPKEVIRKGAFNE